MNALLELEKWCRKYYRFKIGCGGFIQPGDGFYCELKAAGRVVTVEQCDLEKYDEDYDLVKDITISDVIMEALRLWHADDTRKKYECCVDKNNYKFNQAYGIKWEEWGEKRLKLSFTSVNEQEAMDCIRNVLIHDEPFRVYEVK